MKVTKSKYHFLTRMDDDKTIRKQKSIFKFSDCFRLDNLDDNKQELHLFYYIS